MKIKSIEILNYRQITNAIFNLEEGITILAGANNSGKTSIVELFNSVFGSDKEKLSGDDLSVSNCRNWVNGIYPLIVGEFGSSIQNEEVIANIFELIFSYKDEKKQNMILPIELKIQIDYDKDKDDIRNFADYLMDFNPDSTSFYFSYKYTINDGLFRKNFNNYFGKLKLRIEKLVSDSEKNTESYIKEMILKIYLNSLSTSIMFTDSKFENGVDIDHTEFLKLFNFQKIMAGRTLDDANSDRGKILSKNMIEIVSNEDDWSKMIEDLPDQIIQPIEDAAIKDKIKETSLDTLSKAMKTISQTNGGAESNIVIDMNITEESIKSFLKGITSAKYLIDDCFLGESSQGLGYSNLIYMHLQLEKYIKTIDPLLVNFFVIEEPESHMHPQMQNVFTQYLLGYFKSKNELQGFVTTHSHEVVRAAKLPQLRVLRKINTFECKIYDLRIFYNDISNDKKEEEVKELLDFYNWFYSISFPDIVFADKVILYEGDTERMLINSLLKLEKNQFPNLRAQYVSFVQVGGAYAYNYEPILNYLGIKSVVITDIDYNKNIKKIDDIKSSHSTNSSINSFLANITKITKKSLTISEIYSYRESEKPYVILNGTICLTFQGEVDGYSRTLEEAMLCKFYKMNSFTNRTKEEWKDDRNKDKLKYAIPITDSSNIRDIVSSTSKNKTDFMYSVVLANKLEQMLPKYIEEALLWLEK